MSRQKPDQSQLFLLMFYVIHSLMLLAPALFISTPIPEKLFSVRGFWSEETLALVETFRNFILLLWLAVTFITVIFYKFRLLSRLKEIQHKLLLALSIPLVLLTVAEGAGRIGWEFEGDASVLYQDHPYLIVVPKPNAQLGEYMINNLGYRGKSLSITKEEGVFRIVCLGGSSTFSLGVPNEETWPQQLEDQLNSRFLQTMRVEVINAGVPGYTTAESLINLNLRLLDLQPDVIVIYHSYNDYKPNRFPDYEPDYSHWRRPYGKVWRNPLRKWFAFFKMTDWAQTKFLPEKDTGISRFDTVDIPGLDSYQRNLSNMVEIAKARGIQVVLSSEATIMSPETVKTFPQGVQSGKQHVPTLSILGLLDAVEKYDQRVRQVAEKYEVVYVDNLRLVSKDFEHFQDHIHLTKKGCQAVAENFAAAIEGFIKSN